MMSWRRRFSEILLALSSEIMLVGTQSWGRDSWEVRDELRRTGERLRDLASKRLWPRRKEIRQLLREIEYYLFLAHDKGFIKQGLYANLARRLTTARDEAARYPFPPGGGRWGWGGHHPLPPRWTH